MTDTKQPILSKAMWNTSGEKMNKVKSFSQQLSSTLSVYFLSFLCGLATTWLLLAAERFVQVELDDRKKDNFVNNLEISVICGRLTCSAVCFVFVNDVARRIFIVSSALVHAVTWCLLLIIFDVRQLLMYQFVFGVGIALHDIISVVYLAEVTSPRYRSLAIVCDLFFYCLGVESYIFAEFIRNYSLLCTVALTFAIIAIVSVYYTLESPYYLMMAEKESEAMFSLAILNSGGTPDEVINLFKELEKYADQEKAYHKIVDFYKCMSVKSNFKVFLFVVFVSAVTYVDFSEIVTRLRAQNDFILHSYSNLFQIVLIRLFGLLISTIPMLAFKRRFLLLAGFVLAAFLQLVAVVLFYAESTDYNAAFLPTYGQIKTALPALFYGIYVSTIYPTTYALRGEMFPYAMKIKANAVIEIFQLFVPFALHYTVSPVTTYFGVGLTFVLHAALQLLTAVYVYFYYTDTKNRTLLQIHDSYRL